MSFNPYKYSLLMDLAKKYDLDLYNRVLKHEDLRCVSIINDYINGDYNSIKYYLVSEGISSYEFDLAKKYVSSNYPALYENFKLFISLMENI